MPIEPLNVAPALPGQPITSQSWNAIIARLSEVIGALNAQAGQSLRVTVNNPSVDPAETRVTAIAEGPQGAVFEAARPVPPDTTFTLTGLLAGNYTVRAEAPGFTPATVLATLPGTGTAEVTMTRSAPDMPNIFGTPLNEALSALASAGVVVQRVVDVTGREIAPAKPGEEFLKSLVLAQIPVAGDPAPASTGAQLVVSAALEVESAVVMPPLAGLSLSETRKVLDDLGLVLGKVSTRTRPQTE